MKTKNKIIIYIICLILIIGAIVIARRFDSKNYDKKMIVEKSYSNYAWEFQYSGMAIFDDGSIYKWSVNQSRPSKNEEYDEKWILKKGTLLNKKVSSYDMNKIIDYISTIEDNIEKENTAMDAGSNVIYVWNNSGESIILSESGDFTGVNKSENTPKLLELINKYLK